MKTKNNACDLFFIFELIIIIQIIFSQINDDFTTDIIESLDSNLIDFNDYHNLNLVITTAKNIYSISDLTTVKKTFRSEINSYSMAASYNEDYILIACLNDGLLSKININSEDDGDGSGDGGGDSGDGDGGDGNGDGDSDINAEILLNYEDINIEGEDNLVPPSQVCSLSINDNIAYIAISNTVTDDTYTYNKYFIIKINLFEDTNGPGVLSTSFFKFPDLYKATTKNRQFSCEILFVKDTEDKRLVCTFEYYKNINEDNTLVVAKALNNDLTNFEVNEKTFNKYSNPAGFQCYLDDKYKIVCTMRKYIFNMNLYYDSNNNLQINIVKYYDIMQSNRNLYYYVKGFIISSNIEQYLSIYYIQININIGADYRIYDYSARSEFAIGKLLGFYVSDIFYIVYQCEDKIKYITMNGITIKNIFNMQSYSKTYKIISNDNGDATLTLEDDFIGLANDYGTFEIENTLEYQSNNYILKRYLINNTEASNFPYDKDNYIITVPQSDNFWYIYNFAYIYNDANYLRIFYFYNINITIEICAFQCGKCTSDYYTCDNCRNESYSKLIDSTSDNNCYPIDQLIKGYIYYENTQNFEKCYSSCDFCTEPVNISPSADHKCKACSEGFYPSYQILGNCYRINEGELNLEKYVAQETDEYFTSASCTEVGKSYTIITTGECVDSCPTDDDNIYFSYDYNYINFTAQTNEQITEQQYTLHPLNIPKYKFNNICYENCPTNTESSIDNECKCKFAWHKDLSTNKIICYEVDYCIYSEYRYYYDDTKECKENGNTVDYFQFNFECYKEGCPANTYEVDSHKCESTYSYCYINEHFNNFCSDEQNSEYILQYEDTKQYLKLCSESLIYTTSSSPTYLYNGKCYLNCPSEITELDSSNEKCKCKYFGYYIDENNYICYEENDICNDKIPVLDLYICLDTINDCKTNNYKIFNNQCYNEGCPELTKLGSIDLYTCICEFSYYNDGTKLNCFEQEECGTSYSYSNLQTLECFTSLEDCFSKNNNFLYNKYCYKDSCPSGKIALSSITNSKIKNALISELSISNDLINHQCVCDTINTQINWIIQNDADEILQICVESCEDEYEPDTLTRKCVEKCNPSRHYVFNNICYKEGCPEGSKLNESNPDSRICICEKDTYIENDNIICCDESGGTCPHLDLSKCPADYKIYKYNCYSQCPTGTCLTQNDEDLKTCIDKDSYMAEINGICVENFVNIINNIKNNNKLIAPISSVKGSVISGYFANDEVYESSASSNYSLLFLNECEELLKTKNSLPPETQFFVLQIESTDNEKKSAINTYNYGIFLENGTQLDMSACEGTKITLSSPIVDAESVFLDKALYFSEMNYDIYNESSDFYTDTCAPASISGNDITLTDRKTDFFPSNVSLCNDSCEYSYVNLTTKRFICDCDAIPNNTEENDTNIEENIEDNSTYIDYFLSLMNYKITKCFNLIQDINNFKNNYGAYYSLATFTACTILMFDFIFRGMNIVNKFIYNGIPTKSKLLKRIKESEERRKNNLNTNENNKVNNTINNPPPPKIGETDSIQEDKKSLEKEEADDYNLILRLFGKRPKSQSLIIEDKKEEKKEESEKNSKNSKKSKNTKNSKKSKNTKNSKKSKKAKKDELDTEKKSRFYPKKLKPRNKPLKSSHNSSRDENDEMKIETIEVLKTKEDYYNSRGKEKFNINPNYKPIGFKYITEQEKKLLNIDYRNLIIINDDVNQKEFNKIPYTQALRIDNRSICQTFLSVIASKIEIISIFYYRNETFPLSLAISIYLFSLFMDLCLNCFLYSDDVVSEKYHNDGKLEFATSFVLSLMSNIFSAIIVYIIAKLTEFSDILEIIVRDVCDINQYYNNIVKFKKITKLKLTGFFIIQFIFIIFMFYYLSVFCIVFNKSQTSILLNYIYGIIESLAISLGVAVVITIIRFLAIKYKWEVIYNTSRYFYDTL